MTGISRVFQATERYVQTTNEIRALRGGVGGWWGREQEWLYGYSPTGFWLGLSFLGLQMAWIMYEVCYWKATKRRNSDME